MTTRQWYVLLASVILVAILYSLPRSVVENDAAGDISTEGLEAIDAHGFQMSAADRKAVSSLRNLLAISASQEKSIIFADSLADLYLSYNDLDSAEYFADLILEFDTTGNGQKRAGEIFFRIYGISPDQEKARELAIKAGRCFDRLLKDQEDPDLKAKLAMTKVVSSNPMEGIMMLREILEKYPENQTALYNMGLLSMQSGQYDRAVERFEKLLTIDGSNSQAGYYLAVSYFELANKEKSRAWFEKIVKMSSDPAIVSSSEQYLKELNEL